MKGKICKKCKYSDVITAQSGIRFIGCKHPPYEGKWIIHIDLCPKEELNEENKIAKTNT